MTLEYRIEIKDQTYTVRVMRIDGIPTEYHILHIDPPVQLIGDKFVWKNEGAVFEFTTDPEGIMNEIKNGFVSECERLGIPITD